ncbi:MAG: TlpA disulfide reductase family protein [Thermoanaerobaculia bacterium]|nr:TlpA disulfide reductase family protein [Thermoanaerobaculia bacterium]
MDHPIAVLCTTLILLGACTSSPLPSSSDQGPHPHEYAPIERFEVTELDPAIRELYREHLDSFEGTTRTGSTVNLSEIRTDHRVVLLTIFAEWCENCGYEAPELVELHRRFRDRGFAIVARSEYSHPADVERFVEKHGIPYPVLLGSPNPDPEDEDAVRTTTTHYRFRKAIDSTRKWGTPFNVLLVRDEPGAFYAVKGEFRPGALERFLRRRLPDD